MNSRDTWARRTLAHRTLAHRTLARGLAALLAAGLGLGLLAVPAEATSITRATATGTYVALGDSFASAEGLSPYERGTDMATNGCHRSTNQSYPELLERRAIRRFDRLTSVTCSGAITAALFSNLPDRSDERAQLKVLSARTRTVTLTIGGNDVGFSSVLGDCIYTPVPDPALQQLIPGRPGCEQRRDPDVQQALARLGGAPVPGLTLPTVPLIAILSSIHALAPNAKIYLTGYPPLFGATFTAPFGCQVAAVSGIPLFISGPDAQWISRSTTQLNATIEASESLARSIGLPVIYVDVAATFDDHAVCDTGTAWINPLLAKTDGTSLQVSPASFHPTARGQRAYADAVAASLRST